MRSPHRATLILACILTAGCTFNINDREPYRSIVGKTVYLTRPMALWLPKSSDINFNSYPYKLVNEDWKPFDNNGFGVLTPNGSVLAILPIGCALHIDKAKHYNALDDDHDDVLGTVNISNVHGPVHFDFTWGYYQIPWSLTSPRQSALHAPVFTIRCHPHSPATIVCSWGV